MSVRTTLQVQLEPEGYLFEVVASSAEVLAGLTDSPPDAVLCDAAMADIDGVALCRLLKADPVWRFVPVMLIASSAGGLDLVQGLDAGADDFVAADAATPVLQARVRALVRIRYAYRALQQSPATPRPSDVAWRARLVADAGLTPREREVLDLVLQACTHDDIAFRLGISERTSKFHLRNLLEKLRVTSRLELFRLFLQGEANDAGR